MEFTMTLLCGLYGIFRWLAYIVLGIGRGFGWTGRNFALLLIYFIKFVLPVIVFALLVSPLWYLFWGAVLSKHDKAVSDDHLVLTVLFSILSTVLLIPLYDLGKKQRTGILFGEAGRGRG